MGVTRQVRKEGDPTRRCKKGDRVVVHYTGTLADGSQFDSSRGGGREPFAFNVGFGQVIKGWDVAVMEMCLGERSIITCTPDFAYGNRGEGGGIIPPNSTLTFDVEIIEIGGPGTGQVTTMWNRGVGLLVVMFATTLVFFAMKDLLMHDSSFWGLSWEEFLHRLVHKA